MLELVSPYTFYAQHLAAISSRTTKRDNLGGSAGMSDDDMFLAWPAVVAIAFHLIWHTVELP